MFFEAADIRLNNPIVEIFDDEVSLFLCGCLVIRFDANAFFETAFGLKGNIPIARNPDFILTGIITLSHTVMLRPILKNLLVPIMFNRPQY